MSREEIIMILGIIRTAYPRFYANMSNEEIDQTINLWTEMFAEENPQLVILTVKKLITNLEFPPTIADVKKAVYKMTDKTDSNTDLWNAIKKAIRNSAYNYVNEFEKLPDLAKKFVGSPVQLREWALDEEYNDSVVKGQFLKQIEILKEREKDQKTMSQELKDFLNQYNNTKYLE